MKYFIKLDNIGSACDIQASESDASAARLRLRGYIEVSRERYMFWWQRRDARRIWELEQDAAPKLMIRFRTML